MSTAEMLIEKGKQEGRQEGWKEKERIVAKKMKDKGFPVEEIGDITGLSAEEIEAL
jgi:predicted transposase/invertase (TIGR01784 family)